MDSVPSRPLPLFFASAVRRVVQFPRSTLFNARRPQIGRYGSTYRDVLQIRYEGQVYRIVYT